MSKRNHKVHFSRQPGINLCGSPRRGYAESNLSEVTCGNCLRLASKEVTASVPEAPKELQYQVFLLKNGLNRIYVIKTIREHTSLGLKEAKELSDMAYNYETLLLAGASRERAMAFVNELTLVGATVRLDNLIGGSEFFYPGTNGPVIKVLDRVSAITKAYEEMLALFIPNPHVDPEQYLDQFDNDEKTGHRFFPTQTIPTIADVRRWARAGGSK
jgi:ribosomal protein L7/L12